MNPAELHRRSIRQRTFVEVMRDVLNACHRLGALAAAAEIAMQPPDVGELANITEGLRRCLVELRAAGVPDGNP